MNIFNSIFNYSWEITGFCAALIAFTILYLMKSLPKEKENPGSSFKEDLKEEIKKETRTIINYNTEQLNKIISEIPDKVLKSIVSSTSAKKGALGELIGYIELKASYDRIIPLGNIVDFVGIKFSSKDKPGSIDFIDIKTGKFARLSKDQKNLQQLIENKYISFVKVKVESETQC